MTIHRITTELVLELIVPIDPDRLDEIAARRGVAIDQIVREIAADLESRIVDEVRWRDGVDGPAVRSRLVQR